MTDTFGMYERCEVRRGVRGLLASAAGAALLLPGCRVLLEPVPRETIETISYTNAVLRDPVPRLEVPPTLPGANASAPEIPPLAPETREQRLKAIDTLFPRLGELGADPHPKPGSAEPISIDSLIEIAKRHSPIIQQAQAEIERNRGEWLQAGYYPNPTLGYQADQVANQGSAGQQGGFINQTIITGKKLQLAQGVAFYDLMNARLQLRRKEIDLAQRVRTDAFAVMVAAEAIRINRMISDFTENVYHHQVENVKAGQSVPFEAHALRAIVGQNRTSLIQARVRYTSAWKQLTATLNQPEMKPTPIAGLVEATIPRYSFEALKQQMVAAHTDLEIVRNNVAQAEQALLLETRRPIPDLQNNLYFQRDTQLQSFQLGVQLGVQVPLWNKNEGRIAAARATLVSRSKDLERITNDLTRTLADSYERYESNRQQMSLYRELILPDLVRAFRGVYQRYQVEPDKVNYNDIVTAQQNFATQLDNYLTALQGQWQAVADLTAAVQADDPYKLSEGIDPALPDDWPVEPRHVVR